MIGRLRGTVLGEDTDGTVVLDVGGVGYELTVPLGALGRALATDGALELHVHTHVKEDAFELFGFASETERRAFRLLLGVPNVGPRTAIAVLSSLALDELARAVRESDLARLGKVPGVGKKTAERLVMELRDKLPAILGPGGGAGPLPARRPTSAQAASLHGALVHMGYRPAEAERAIKTLGEALESEPLPALIRRALGVLAP